MITKGVIQGLSAKLPNIATDVYRQ